MPATSVYRLQHPSLEKMGGMTSPPPLSINQTLKNRVPWDILCPWGDQVDGIVFESDQFDLLHGRQVATTVLDADDPWVTPWHSCRVATASS